MNWNGFSICFRFNILQKQKSRDGHHEFLSEFKDNPLFLDIIILFTRRVENVSVQGTLTVI